MTNDRVQISSMGLLTVNLDTYCPSRRIAEAAAAGDLSKPSRELSTY